MLLSELQLDWKPNYHLATLGFYATDKQAKNGLIVLMVISPKSQEELGLLPLSAVRKEEVWN